MMTSRDACLAADQCQQTAFITVDMKPGKVTRGAGNNFNRATETVDGSHLDVVNMVLYQTATNLECVHADPLQTKESGGQKVENH